MKTDKEKSLRKKTPDIESQVPNILRNEEYGPNVDEHERIATAPTAMREMEMGELDDVNTKRS